MVLCGMVRVEAHGFRERSDDCGSGHGHTFEERVVAILGLLCGFGATPFTVQRLAELVKGGRETYSSTRKWLNAVTKAVTVSSPVPNSEVFAAAAAATPYHEGLPADVAAARAHFEAQEQASGDVAGEAAFVTARLPNPVALPPGLSTDSSTEDSS